MSAQSSFKSTHQGTQKDAVLISTQSPQSELMNDEGIMTLRQRLKQLGVWPDAADQLLVLMPHSRWQNSPLVEADYQWMTQVVEDSLNGVDIGAYYPAFFQKLLANSDLRQTFLNKLDARLATV